MQPRAATIVVTTTNNVSPGTGKSFAQAIAEAQDGDTIGFNIPGAGPFVIETPDGGYDFITKNNLVIDGYSQPGSSPNSGGILSPNVARIQIVLDSRNGNFKLMDDARLAPNDDPGFGNEAAILGIVGATNVTIRGLSLVGAASVGSDAPLYAIALARGASGAHIAGNWFGVLPDGLTVAGTANGVAGFRYQEKDENGATTNSLLIDNTVIGVGRSSTNAPADFNVFVGNPHIPIALEGNGTRIAGNFIMVYPSGTNDYNVSDLIPGSVFEGAIEIGRGGNDTVIGVDGDGVNDANERNIFGGTYPASKGGYDHTIEFYGQNPGTNIVVAGNYFGVGIDGATRFNNGVPPLNATGGQAQYRFGSDFDGVSDALEGNLVVNNWPADIFDPTEFAAIPEQLNFFDELDANGVISVRGNSLINNFPMPASADRNSGGFLSSYMSKVLLDSSAELAPVISAESSTDRITGTAPLPAEGYKAVVDLYTADPEGIQTGQATGLPEFAGGWVQGKRYLASVPVSAAGDFSAGITNLAVAANTPVTATANYIPVDAVAHNAPTVTGPFAAAVALKAGSGGGSQGDIKIESIASVANNSVTLTWTGGAAPFVVQKTSALGSAWSAATTTNERTVTLPKEGQAGFFRIQGAQ